MNENPTPAENQDAQELLRLRVENARLRGALETFARRISHDLRTPLGSVLTLTQLLQEITPTEQAETREMLGSIIGSAERLRDLIEQGSTIARLEAEAPELSPISMQLVARAASDRVAYQAAKVGGRIQTVPDWPTVLGHAPTLELLWRILLTNALQHGGVAPQVEMGWRAEGTDRYRFFVRDSGPGIPPARWSAAFTPFHHLHASNAARGLGLAIAERIVSAHGGDCGCEKSADGRFEAFFTLPAGG